MHARTATSFRGVGFSSLIPESTIFTSHVDLYTYGLHLTVFHQLQFSSVCRNSTHRFVCFPPAPRPAEGSVMSPPIQGLDLVSDCAQTLH